MKKLILLLAICAFSTSVFAQKARVYEHFTASTAWGKGAIVPAISYTQTLAIGNKFGFRFNSGVRFTQYIIRNGTELENTVSNKNRSLQLTSNLRASALNIPIGIEIGNRFVAVGVNADLLGFTLRTEQNGDSFEVQNGQKPENIVITPAGFNFLITQKGTLNTQFYASLTPTESFTIRAGMALTQASFNTSYPDAVDATIIVDWDSFRESTLRPFVALQFNFEK